MQNLGNENFESSIIRNSNEQNLIYYKLKLCFFEKNFYLKLIYKATIDGDNSKNFHEKCDGISPILVIIQTKDNYRFGGYTHNSFESLNEAYKKDDSAFIFSLDKLMTYDVLKGNDAIFCDTRKGPCFCYDINIVNQCFKNDNTVSKRQGNYNTCVNYEINFGNEKFRVEDYEVFQIVFNG